MELFGEVRRKNFERVAPLAVRMRPRTLDEFVGQAHFLGKGKLLRRMLEADRLTSVIFYGPPGTGKTTLASLIAIYTKSHFESVNAAAVGVKEVRQILDNREPVLRGQLPAHQPQPDFSVLADQRRGHSQAGETRDRGRTAWFRKIE